MTFSEYVKYITPVLKESYKLEREVEKGLEKWRFEVDQAKKIAHLTFKSLWAEGLIPETLLKKLHELEIYQLEDVFKIKEDVFRKTYLVRRMFGTRSFNQLQSILYEIGQRQSPRFNARVGVLIEPNAVIRKKEKELAQRKPSTSRDEKVREVLKDINKQKGKSNRAGRARVSRLRKKLLRMKRLLR